MKKIKKSYNWGILGLGKIAGKFAADLKNVPNANLYAAASRNSQKAEEFAKEFSFSKSFGSYEEMLKDPDLDVVYIATPHSFHKENSLLCLQYKKAVLCEKPFAMNAEEVEEMIAKAKKENVFLMEALWTNFLPHYKYVLDLVKKEQFGKVKSLKADFGFKAPFDAEQRLFKKEIGGGSLLDVGIYPVFAALTIMGVPENITATAQFGQTLVDEKRQIKFEYPNSRVAYLDCSIIEKTPTTALIEMEKGEILIHSRFHEPTKISIHHGKETITKEFKIEGNGYNYEAEHVQEMLDAGKTESNIMTFEKSKNLIELLDRIRKEIGLEY